MKIKKVFDQFFLLSKSERSGAIILLLIVCLLFIVRISLPIVFAPNESKKFKFSEEIEQFEALNDSAGYIDKIEKKNSNSTQYVPIRNKAITTNKSKKDNNSVKELFRFNPNQISLNELIKLGFSQSAASNLLNYRLKGGIFRDPNDVRKIYGVDSIFFKTIRPFIIIEENVKVQVDLELNSADSSAFTL